MQPGGLTAVIVVKSVCVSRLRAIILVSIPNNIRMEPSMNSVDQKLSSSDASAAEVRRLLKENARLRSLLIAHGIPIPEAAQPTLDHPQASNSAPEAQKPGIATAEQRIALFRTLFRGREDIYAIRWENNDGRSGYMPKADRDWKSFLSAKDEDRKKVDRLKSNPFRLRIIFICLSPRNRRKLSSMTHRRRAIPVELHVRRLGRQT
jgi:hypothetical protein